MKDEDWMLDTVEVWAIALTDLQITKKELVTAQRKSMSLEWPPTAPADFLALARTVQASQYPTANDAFDNACSQSGLIEDKYVKRQWLHDVVQLTAHRIGMGRLKTADNKFLSYFKKVYEQVCSEHEAGTLFLVPEERQLAHSHQPVEAGSEADKKISKKLAQLRKISA